MQPTPDQTTQVSSPPRKKKRGLFASYEKHLDRETDESSLSKPCATASIMSYIDSLTTIVPQVRKNGWNVFRSDSRFSSMHLLLEKLLCIPATSAPVERVFSHGGLFMQPHRARMGQKVLSDLVFAKCNKHLTN